MKAATPPSGRLHAPLKALTTAVKFSAAVVFRLSLTSIRKLDFSNADAHCQKIANWASFFMSEMRKIYPIVFD